jgi:2-dehydro-3-deoxygluconokinase
VGKRLPRGDAVAKVTGRAVYGIDYEEPRMLHAKVLRSPVAAGRIVRLDVSKAERMPGVRGVITAEDAPYLMGFVVFDMPLLARDVVRTSARVLTLGETMALLDPMQDGPIADGGRFRLRVAGAESNFAIALTRLGVRVTWASRVGQDPFGELILATLASEGLDLTYARRDRSAATGVFFKAREPTGTRILYYRANSAACQLRPGDVPEEALDGVELLHLTGITMGISRSARELVTEIGARAHERGVTVLFDPNFRSALWESPVQALAAYRKILPYIDWYLSGLEESRLLFGTADVDEAFAALRDAGIGNAVLRVGARGALVDAGSGPVEIPPKRVETIVDEVGAGDGFAAGFAYGLLHGWRPELCAVLGNLVAARALRGTGDWETYPRSDEVAAELLHLGNDAARTRPG